LFLGVVDVLEGIKEQFFEISLFGSHEHTPC
jgi:hypothetical protein